VTTYDDDRDLPGPAGLCRLATELVEQALHRVPALEPRAVRSASEAVAAVDRALARSYLATALDQLRYADAALLPYVSEDRVPPASGGRLLLITGGVEDELDDSR
jgi:hypothetical protein